MYKISFAVALTAIGLCYAAVANSQNTQPVQPKPTPSTVSQAQQLPDNSPVVLQGTIVAADNTGTYILTDSTGSVNLEIDTDDLSHIDPSPNDIVIIQGEVDKNGNLTEIDVEDISLAQ